VDSSGIRITYTFQLRKYDAGVLELADPYIEQTKAIPQGWNLIEYEYQCPSVCTNNFPENITIFGSFLHMHQIGSQIWSTHWRNGELIGEINRIDFWDFAFQQVTPRNITVVPGDIINTHCIYQEQQNTSIIFALGSSQEMCVQYVYYYPRLPPSPIEISPGQDCAFGYSSDIDRNFTYCNGDVILVTNPETRDPPGGNAIEFGSTNPVDFKCAADVVQATETEPFLGRQGIETKASSNVSNMEIGGSIGAVLGMMLVAAGVGAFVAYRKRQNFRQLPESKHMEMTKF